MTAPVPTSPTPATARGRGLIAALHRPVDIASLAMFRILFGALMCAGLVRFLLSGWIPRFYDQPTFFFKYWGFEWVPVGPLWFMYAVYAALAVLALAIAAGLFYRVSVALFLIGFTYTQLLDVTNYLNHYYLVILLSGLLLLLPLHRAWSVDVWRRPERRVHTLPAWNLYLLRFQIGIVYTFAGLAKFNSDWLLYAQPLNIWLTARTETPIIGPWLDELWVAYAFSWAGFLFDSTIIWFLSCRRTRPYAYAVVLFFHAMTAVFFNIGMFPYIMVVSAMVFFSPSWPRRFGRGRVDGSGPTRAQPASGQVFGQTFGQTSGQMFGQTGPRLPSAGLAALALYCVIQVAVPLRHYVYNGDVAWNEEGMRYSWKVMLREKHGSVTYHVRMPATGKQLQVTPRQYLAGRQEREMAGQPDLILQLAHHIAASFRARGYGPVEVRAEALVSLNGRPAQHLIDTTVDLAQVEDGLAPKEWILPAPAMPPIQLRTWAGR